MINESTTGECKRNKVQHEKSITHKKGWSKKAQHAKIAIK